MKTTHREALEKLQEEMLMMKIKNEIHRAKQIQQDINKVINNIGSEGTNPAPESTK